MDWQGLAAGCWLADKVDTLSLLSLSEKRKMSVSLLSVIQRSPLRRTLSVEGGGKGPLRDPRIELQNSRCKNWTANPFPNAFQGFAELASRARFDRILFLLLHHYRIGDIPTNEPSISRNRAHFCITTKNRRMVDPSWRIHCLSLGNGRVEKSARAPVGAADRDDLSRCAGIRLIRM